MILLPVLFSAVFVVVVFVFRIISPDCHFTQSVCALRFEDESDWFNWLELAFFDY